MTRFTLLGALTAAAFLGGCAGTRSQAPTATQATPSAAPVAATAPAPVATGATRIVKSRDGRFDGEMIGTPVAGSKFTRLQIGMTMSEVNALIGTPNDITKHETGKRWIPFYFGNDAQRMQALYQGEGCLSYTGGNQFGGGSNELIRIHADRNALCWSP